MKNTQHATGNRSIRVKVMPMKGDDIAERMLDFASRTIRLVDALPKRLVGKHIGAQLLRCGTSAGANYEEGRGAESRSDFVPKLSVARKEACEASFWLHLIQGTNLVKPELVESLVLEAHELAAILSASIKTAKAKA
jgi:four helix bundle protein